MATSGKDADSDKTKAEGDALMQELATLRSDVVRIAERVSQIGHDRVSGAVSQGLEKGDAALADVTAELRSIESDIIASTKRNPFRALGTAALVGFVLGLLLRR